jgi:NAD(P)-dependent dehydrogenase (short-subunit alcohol dehydrogenase family)
VEGWPHDAIDDFAGKVPLVTGAGSGMGRATALAFSMPGASVVAADIDEPSVHEAVSLIEKQGGTAIAVCAVVSDGDAVETLVRRCVDQFGLWTARSTMRRARSAAPGWPIWTTQIKALENG